MIAIEGVGQFRELQTRFEREAATRKILDVISRSRDDEQPVLRSINETAMRLCQASESAIWVIEGDQFRLGGLSSADKTLASFMVEHPIPLDHRSVGGRAVANRAPVQVSDLQLDPGTRDLPVTRRAQSRTVLAVPLLSDGGQPLGAITIYRREVRPFEDQQIEIVETFAAQAVIAIENVRQFKALQARTEEVQALNETLEARVEAQVGEIERMGRLKRFLSPAVADAVVSSGNNKLLSSHRALIPVLFCDIRGFTAFCETAEPEETIEVLQTYHEEMGQLINAYGAGVDHRMGDGIMVLFNDPLPREDPAGDALRLALAMQERMASLCSQWRRLGHRLGFGVGISLGYATVGMVGSEGRFEYTASGTTVNLAARLCGEAADGEILISPRAYAAIEEQFEAELRGEVSLKGMHEPVKVHRVVGSRMR